MNNIKFYKVTGWKEPLYYAGYNLNDVKERAHHDSLFLVDLEIEQVSVLEIPEDRYIRSVLLEYLDAKYVAKLRP